MRHRPGLGHVPHAAVEHFECSADSLKFVGEPFGFELFNQAMVRPFQVGSIIPTKLFPSTTPRTLGVSRSLNCFGMSFGLSSSKTAQRELVVPRSMPTILAMGMPQSTGRRQVRSRYIIGLMAIQIQFAYTLAG